MASDYGLRGEAAMRLLKGKKRPPEEEELGLPPEDAEGPPMPPEEGAGEADLAALLGGGMPGEAPVEEAPPPGAEGGEPPPPPDLETVLGSVEAALEGLPPEAAEEIRIHLNAIREIASGGQGSMEPPPMAGPSPDMAPAGDMPKPPEAEAL